MWLLATPSYRGRYTAHTQSAPKEREPELDFREQLLRSIKKGTIRLKVCVSVCVCVFSCVRVRVCACRVRVRVCAYVCVYPRAVYFAPTHVHTHTYTSSQTVDKPETKRVQTIYQPGSMAHTFEKALSSSTLSVVCRLCVVVLRCCLSLLLLYCSLLFVALGVVSVMLLVWWWLVCCCCCYCFCVGCSFQIIWRTQGLSVCVCVLGRCFS